MFIPFIIIIPGMMAAVLISPLAQMKSSGSATGEGGITYNDSLLLLMKQLLPNGLLGVAIAGLLAAFMAGMAANISAFNTVMSYDIWQTYIQKHKPDNFYTAFGRGATVVATALAIGTSYFASQFPNIMTYLQTLFGFFNAPLFATFILGMFWKRMTATAAWTGLVSGTLAAVLIAFLSEDAFGSASTGVLHVGGQGASFLAAGAAFVVDIVVSVLVTFATEPKPDSALRGLVYSETPKEDLLDEHEDHWWLSATKLAGVSLVMVIILNIIFR
jgi:SSS family solute:Na+ symporter